MARNKAGKWEVAVPGGSYLDISKSKTQGLQEAIDHATANKLAMEVIGGTSSPDRAAVIHCTETVTIPEMDGWHLDVIGATIAVSDVGDAPGLSFGVLTHSSINIRGLVAYRGTGPAVLVRPAKSKNLSPPLFVDNDIRIFRILVLGGPGARGLELDSGLGSIQRSRFDLIEIEGGNDAQDAGAMAVGIMLRTPGGGIQSNHFWVRALLRSSQWAVSVGDNEDSGGNATLNGNVFDVHVENFGASSGGLRNLGINGRFRLDLMRGTTPFATGIYTGLKATGNAYDVIRNDAQTPEIEKAPKGANRVI